MTITKQYIAEFSVMIKYIISCILYINYNSFSRIIFM